MFQPYSGVKTSILILDKKLNQNLETVFFAKVENDGFSLGAQRTVSSKNDLPKASKQFRYFCDEPTSSNETVSKQVILDSADFSLSLSKFQTVEVKSNFDVVKLKELVDDTTKMERIHLLNYIYGKLYNYEKKSFHYWNQWSGW